MSMRPSGDVAQEGKGDSLKGVKQPKTSAITGAAGAEAAASRRLPPLPALTARAPACPVPDAERSVISALC